MGLIQKLILGYFREGTFISRGNNNQKHFSIKVCAQKATHISFIDISRVVTHSFERVCNNGKFSYRCGTCPICMCCLLSVLRSHSLFTQNWDSFFHWNHGINNKATTGGNPLLLFSWEQRRRGVRHRVVEHSMLSP